MTLLLIFFLFVFILIYKLFKRIGKLEREIVSLGERLEEQMPREVITAEECESTDSEILHQMADEVLESIPEKSIETIDRDEQHVNQVQYNSPQKPNDDILSKLIKFVKNYFTQGNIIVRIGGVILFFGLAFLVKYTAEHSTVSMEMRLIGVAVVAIVLLIVGWRLREREGSYGTILQGLGIALFYLVVFAAAKLYTILSLELAFGLMFVIVLIGSLLAVIQNALPLALFAITGGFLAPIITSDGSGSHIVLFSYYLLLDAGIVGIAWYRSWRWLNITGFFFTFVIATAWGVLRYDPALLSSTEPFLILFFLFYLVITILFTLKQPFEPRDFIDGTLVFGLPLVAFSLQVSLVYDIEYAVAYSAVGVGTLYLLLSKILFGFERMRLLGEAFLALGVVFYTMAVPYALDDQLTGAIWVLEATAIIWIALRQKRTYARLFGEFLQIIALFIFVMDSLLRESDMVFINVIFFSFMVITAALLASSYLLFKNRSLLSSFDAASPALFLLLGLGVWIVSGAKQADDLSLIMPFVQGNTMLIYTALGSLVLASVAIKLRWSQLSTALQWYTPLGLIWYLALIEHYTQFHPFEGLGLIAFALFVAVHFLLLKLFDKEWNYQSILHPLGLWIIVAVLMRESAYQMSLITQNITWNYIALLIPPLIIALLIFRVKALFSGFLKAYQSNYKLVGVGGLMFVVTVWEFVGFGLAGDAYLFTYIPLLNPLDFIQLIGLLILFYWVYHYRDRFLPDSKVVLFTISSVMLLILSSVIFARSVHFYREVAYTIPTLLEDIFFQAGLSILWSLIAIVIMFSAKYLINRTLWMVGMGLLGLVVLKLFVVELGSSGTVERIISFIAVGALMLLIGYFAPLPPKRD